MAQRGSGGAYNRPFNVVGRDADGMEVVRSGILIGGVPHIQDEATGDIVPAASVLSDVRIGGRGESQDVTAGAGGVPNAVAISDSGIPSFSFSRESDGQAYSWATRAFAAETDLTAMIEHYGPETFTSLTSGLQQWASQNAREAITPAVINSLLEDSGIQGAARSAMGQFLQAVLRSDTGAAYTGTEIADYAGTFLPNPGDDLESVLYKREARMNAIRGIVPRAGPAAPYLLEVLDGKRNLPGNRWKAPAPQKGALDQSNASTGIDQSTDDILKGYGL